MTKKLSWRQVLVIVGGVCLLDPCARVANAVDTDDGTGGERPNIVWLIGEQLSPDFGCYGERAVRTPNIDRLASEGARYTRAYVTSSLCAPSRSALISGMYQTSLGAHHHRTRPRVPLPAGVLVLTHYLREAGYFTCNGIALNWSAAGKTDYNFEVENPFDGTDWRQRNPGQPFHAQVQFHEAHRVFASDPQNPIDPDKVDLPPYYPDHPIARRDWADYLECLQVFDKKVGRVLARLDEDGLSENTIVILLGDNGREHLRGMNFLYEGGIRIPLIIRWPGHIEPGTVNEDLVSAIDLAPTCLSIAGIDPPDHMHGQVILGPSAKTREYIVAAQDRVDGTYDRMRCVRTARFKYIRNFFPEFPYRQYHTRGTYNYVYLPVATLMEVLHAEERLTPSQAQFMSPRRPAEELYDLLNDPY